MKHSGTLLLPAGMTGSGVLYRLLVVMKYEGARNELKRPQLVVEFQGRTLIPSSACTVAALSQGYAS